MRPERRLAQLTKAFLDTLPTVPRDLFVSKYESWVGPGPAEQIHYTVEYDSETIRVLERVAQKDLTLHPLNRQFTFHLDEKNRQLHVVLVAKNESSW